MKHFMIIAALVMGMGLPMSAKTVNNVNENAGQKADSVQVVDSMALEMKRMELKELEMKQAHQEEIYRMKHKSLSDSFDDDLLVPIGICVVLPIVIVSIVFAVKRKRDREQTEILKLMIEKGQDVTPFIEAQKKLREKGDTLARTLIWGFVCALGGMGLTMYCIFSYDNQLLLIALPLVGVGIALIVGTLIARQWKEKKDEHIELNEPEK